MRVCAQLIAMTLLLSSYARRGEAAVRDGDIVFQTSRSSQSQAIQLATHSPYSHMGLVLIQKDQPFVLEAIAHVQLTPLAEWAARGENGRFIVKRLRDGSILGDPVKLSALRKAALRLKGSRYDPYFEWSDEGMYCSELVWKAFERGLGIQLGATAPLRSFDLSDELVSSKLTERFGANVPLDERVISPAAIFDSPLLDTVQ